jgi:hypothetical protein
MPNRSITIVSLLVLMLSAAAVPAQESLPPSSVDPAATKVLKRMSDFMNSLKSFSARAESSIDSFRDDGQKIKLHRGIDIHARRPDRLRADVDGDFLDQQLFYDGKTITLYEKDKRYFGTIPATGDMGEAFEAAESTFGLVAPAADLIFKDSYGTLMTGVTQGIVIGESTIDQRSCLHLAFRGKETDWEIWVEDSDTPLPRQFIITSKWVAGAPQFSARFTRWDIPAQHKDEVFNFVKQAGDSKIDFLPVEAQ